MIVIVSTVTLRHRTADQLVDALRPPRVDPISAFGGVIASNRPFDGKPPQRGRSLRRMRRRSRSPTSPGDLARRKRAACAWSRA